MEVIAIGKPAINVYLPLQEFPSEGDLFTINTKSESVGNVAATSACLLAKWGVSSHFSGVVGNDSYAEKIREIFKNNRVSSNHLETNFTSGTCVNYITLNVKTGITTKILYNDFNVQLTKFKYEFIPDFAIIDGTDFAGALALINNSGSTCKTLFYARRGDKDTISLSKKCTYVVCTESFAESLTHEVADGSAESYVNMYQKIVDASGKSNYIVILNNHKILYAVDGAVKMLPEMKINIVDQSSFDSIFVGSLAYALIKEVSLDDAIKFANTAAAISLTKVGEESAIPLLDEVLNNSGLKKKFGVDNVTTNGLTQAQEVTPLMSNSVSIQESTPMDVALENQSVAPQTEITQQYDETAISAFDVSGFQDNGYGQINESAKMPGQPQFFVENLIPQTQMQQSSDGAMNQSIHQQYPTPETSIINNNA